MVQNSAARLIAKLPKHCHITPVLKGLHWLPIKQRIDFKLLLITYKSLNNIGPDYLKELLIVNHQTRQLRSKTRGDLYQPAYKLQTCGKRAFAVNAPRLWNQLPPYIKKTESVQVFKKHLKTHLFNIAYPD